jgi:hypothetical protein
MSIKDLFDNRKTNNETLSADSYYTGSKDVGSIENVKAKQAELDRFIPQVDYATASNFAKYGSAEMYYEAAIERVYKQYPYDGSRKEKNEYQLSSSYFDKYVFDNIYPRTNGFAILGAQGVVQDSVAKNIVTPTIKEYIHFQGGPHTASGGMVTPKLSVTFTGSNVYDVATRRASALEYTAASGSTIEFWMKKNAASYLDANNKQFIFDLWNQEPTGSTTYGRLSISISGSTNPFAITLQSGSSGVYDQTLSTTLTPSDVFDGSWHHYAVSIINAVEPTVNFYVDGNLNHSQTILGIAITNIRGVSGANNALIGGLIHDVKGVGTYVTGSGKFSGSLDEFRYWKVDRTGREIKNNFFIPIGGGTNDIDYQDTADLGVYFKFNEGITGDTSTDSTVLDYSGRIANGVWTGYTSTSRNTNSAMVLSGKALSEFKDPIIYSSHPDVSSSLATYKTSGSYADLENTSLFYHLLPSWVTEEDTESGKSTKKLSQIMGSYFDTLHAQISASAFIHDETYASASFKAIPFADRLLKNRGFVVPEIFVDATIIEKILQKDENRTFERSISEVRNLIYKNIYNNLLYMYKSKGTEKAFRNMLRCFGVDSNLIKLNLYADDVTFTFQDTYENTAVEKRYIDFNQTASFGATVWQTTSSATDTDQEAYIRGGGGGGTLLNISSSLTLEAEIILPKKLQSDEKGYFNTSFISSSLFGFRNVDTVANDPAWGSPNFGVRAYFVRDEVESKSGHFKLEYGSSDYLVSPHYNDVYDNSKWNLAVRVKSDQYPLNGGIYTGSAVPGWVIEFYGVNAIGNTVIDEFSLTANTTKEYITDPKRVYAGAFRENFTGSLQQSTDVKISSVRYWQSYLDDDVMKFHAYDPSNAGVKYPTRQDNIFQNSTDADEFPSIQIPQIETLALNWDFGLVTGSDASGEFYTEDLSSGSAGTADRYGTWMGKIVNYKHPAQGAFFPTSNSKIVDKDYVYAAKQRLPEVVYSSDMVTVATDQTENFFQDPDVTDNFYSFEKSMYGSISEEMMKMFATIVEFNNLVGEPVHAYRESYKEMAALRQLFFEKVENNPDFDRFTNFYKWIDDSISTALRQFYPASARFSSDVRNMVESHVLERNKYVDKYPMLAKKTATAGAMAGAEELLYDWRFGHAPGLDGLPENQNCLWQKERKERGSDTTANSDRETIRQVLVNQNNFQGPTLRKVDGTSYNGSTFAMRKLRRHYKSDMRFSREIHGGINYSKNKDRMYFRKYTAPAGPIGTIAEVPTNVIHVGLGTGSSGRTDGTYAFVDCVDSDGSAQKRKWEFQVVNGAIGDQGYNGILTGEQKWPFNFMSGNISTGYNSDISSSFKDDAVAVNVHSDTFTSTNEIGMQGPFTEAWVGGVEARHVPVNRYNAALPAATWQGSQYNGVKATGYVSLDISGITNSDTFALTSSAGTAKQLFTLDRAASDSPPNIVWDVGDLDASLTALQTTIQYYIDDGKLDMTITNTDISGQSVKVTLQSNVVGTTGNQAITKNGADITIDGMDDGEDPDITTFSTNIDGLTNRPEAYGILLGETAAEAPDEGAIGITAPDYGSAIAVKGYWFRDVQTKRPVNVANIQYNTGSAIAGNFRHNYEVVQTVGRTSNNLGLRAHRNVVDLGDFFNNTYLPSGFTGKLATDTTNPYTLVGQNAGAIGNVFKDGTNRYYDIPAQSLGNIFTKPLASLDDGTYNNTVIVSQFSAPGAFETSNGYLDTYAKEFSAYNALPWRNLTVRSKGSGEDGTVRVVDQLGYRRGLMQLQQRHCGKFGLDSEYGSPEAAVFNGESSGDIASRIDIGTAEAWNDIIGTDASDPKVMTFSCWFNAHSLGASNNGRIFSIGESTTYGIRAYLTSTPKVTFLVSWTTKEAYWEVNTGFALDEWTHLAITYDGNDKNNTPKIYINGIEMSFSTTNQPTSGDMRPINHLGTVGLIGNIERATLTTTFDRAFDGFIDEFAIWNNILTQEDVTKIYNAGRADSLYATGLDSDVQGWWRMGENSDANRYFHDMSGYGRHGTGYNVGLSFMDEAAGSFHKINKNVGRKLAVSSSYPKFNYDYDNDFVTHPIPRSDFQYSWINAATAYSADVYSGQQVMYSHSPYHGEVKSITEFTYNTSALSCSADKFTMIGTHGLSWNDGISVAGWYMLENNAGVYRDRRVDDDLESSPFAVTLNSVADALLIEIPYMTSSVPQNAVPNAYTTYMVDTFSQTTSSLEGINWFHLVVTHDGVSGSAPKVFVNSEEQDVVIHADYVGEGMSLATVSSGSIELLGGNANANGQYDEISLWNAPLDESRIIQLYTQNPKFQTNKFRTNNLVGWWRFGDTTDAYNVGYSNEDVLPPGSGKYIYARHGAYNLTTSIGHTDTAFKTTVGNQTSGSLISYVPAITFPSASEITGV